MDLRKVYFQELPQIMEAEYARKHSWLLATVQRRLLQFSTVVRLISDHLNLLLSLSRERTKSEELISHCLEILHSSVGRRVSYLDRDSIATLVDFTRQASSLRITLHSLAHLESDSKFETKRSLRLIDQALELLREMGDRLREQLQKHRQLYSHLQERFRSIGATIKRLAKDFPNAESVLSIDNYSIHFNALLHRASQSVGRSTNMIDYNLILFLSKERILIAKKLEIILEYPRFLAFQYSTDLNHLYEGALAGSNLPLSFRSIVNTMNSPAFVESHLFRYPIEDFIETIRILHRHEKENEEETSESLVAIYYDEQIFLDLCAEYSAITRLLKLADFESAQLTLKDYRFSSSQEYKHLKEVGEKLYEFCLRVLRFNMFNKLFDEFREDTQRFFLEEFGRVIDIYY